MFFYRHELMVDLGVHEIKDALQRFRSYITLDFAVTTYWSLQKALINKYLAYLRKKIDGLLHTIYLGLNFCIVSLAPLRTSNSAPSISIFINIFPYGTSLKPNSSIMSSNLRTLTGI